uniref:Uncharacterized protein n=1 Tax=Arundo donax TaxID=35708 RepID=A0A0A9G242_ARUDO
MCLTSGFGFACMDNTIFKLRHQQISLLFVSISFVIMSKCA